MSILGTILDRLSHDVEIEISKTSVALRCAGRCVTLTPVIHLSAASPRRVLGVGDAGGFTEPWVSVSLFDANPLPVPDISKGECIEAFFRMAVHKVGKTRDLVRPRMIISGAQTLREVCGGYEEWILRDMAMSVGARECVFRS